MNARRAVITGRGIVSPLGIGLPAHAAAMAAGRSAIAPLDRLAALGLGVSRGASISPEMLSALATRLPRKQQKLYNRATVLAILAASLAMEEAGLAGHVAAERFGVLLGVNALWWDFDAMTEFLGASESGERPGELDMSVANAFCMRSINPLDYSLKTLPNLAAGHVAIQQDARGLCRALIDGTVGGAQAIAQATALIAAGELDAALCGGTDAQLEPLSFVSNWGLGLLASDDGTTPGAVFGEGAGLLVLEAEEQARARGARIFGEVTAFTSGAGDGRVTPEQTAGPLAARLSRVIAAVIDAAGTEPDALVLHGDGTPAYEAAERDALAQALGPRGHTLPRLRAKPVLGHLGAAAVPVEVLSASAVFGPPAGLRHTLTLSIGTFGECAALMTAERPA